MKVLHVITALGMGGAEGMLVRLVAHSDPSRFQHRILSLSDEGIFGPLLREQGQVVECLDLKRGRIPWGLLRLPSLVRRFRPDLIQTWLPHADLVGAVLGRLTGIPVSWNLRCSDMGPYTRRSSFILRLCRALSGVPRAVVSNSLAAIESHQRYGFRPPQWVHIPNGFNVESYAPDPDGGRRLRAQLGIADDTPLLGMVARFDTTKDYVGLLEASERIHRHGCPHHIVLVGPGVERSNPFFAGASERIHLMGLQSRPEIPRILQGLDVFCLASFTEGFPNALGEAMATGLTCVATPVGDCPQIMGDTGLLVRPHTIEGLEDALRHALTMPVAQRQELGARARQRILDEFSIEVVVRRYQSLYASLG